MHTKSNITLITVLAWPLTASAIDPGAALGQAFGQIIQQGMSGQKQPAPQSQPQTTQHPKQSQQPQQQPKKKNQEPALASAFNSKGPTQRLGIETYLKNNGYMDSTPDGKWGDETKVAIELYAENFDLDDQINSKNGAAKVIQKIMMQSKDGVDADSSKSIDNQKTVVAATTGTIAAVSATAQASATNTSEIQKLKDNYEDLQKQLMLLKEIQKNQQARPESQYKQAKITAISAQISAIEISTTSLSTQLSTRYSTPVRPINANLGITAKLASEIFPKIPYYIPGTKETGEMLVTPAITEQGELKYSFSFLDPDNTIENVRETITLSPEDINVAITGFEKVKEWSDQAQADGIRKIFEKRASCFPQPNCGEKKKGVSSTEIDFLIYEDGSTAAKVQRNKGVFSTGFNFSIESSLLLTAYLEYMRDVGQKEFTSGSMTKEDLDKKFQ
jgi:hypothetical protein